MKSHVLYREEQAGDPSSKIRNLAMLSTTCVCGGRGHYAQICPSSKRATNQSSSHRRITQMRCYNCNQLGHIRRYSAEPATGQSISSQRPVARAEQGPRVIKYGSIHKSVLQRINCSFVPTYSTIKGYSEDREF